MIRIVKKQRVPAVFAQIKNRRSDYDELLSNEKDELKALLIEEQGCKCAYCMSKIDLGVKTTLQKIAMHTKINNFLKI